jgi:hypothetical protein
MKVNALAVFIASQYALQEPKQPSIINMFFSETYAITVENVPMYAIPELL